MSARVVADENGIWTTESGGTHGFSWPEIAGAGVYVLEVPPNDQRVLTVEIDHVSGEFLTITGDFDGFAEAVAAVAARMGCVTPNLAALTPADDVVQVRPAG
ncbi:hypothetical protein OG394_04850 [Kribbella sp. NBC_01245]|uniref:hypothetical protein n=1 Tax=Kribbella sp. NBC_01245 TaxID=2903578 RepID=UPI002E299990|nr:hypothetical protein [Kribbella sp. NBC_01245]